MAKASTKSAASTTKDPIDYLKPGTIFRSKKGALSAKVVKGSSNLSGSITVNLRNGTRGRFPTATKEFVANAFLSEYQPS